MSQNTKTVLGLSIDTRSMGYAIHQDAILHDWHTRSFKEKWSDKKMLRICQWLQSLILERNITVIAMKIPQSSNGSPKLQQLISEIKKVALKKDVALRLYTIEDIYAHCLLKTRSNKSALMDYLSQKYPELNREYMKEKSSRNAYHIKTFEAVGASCVMKGRSRN